MTLRKIVFGFLWISFDIASFPIRIIVAISIGLMRFYNETSIALFDATFQDKEKSNEYNRKAFQVSSNLLRCGLPNLYKKEEP